MPVEAAVKTEGIETGVEPAKQSDKPSGYQCAACNTLNNLMARDAIRCQNCGHRILYKARERRRTVAVLFVPSPSLPDKLSFLRAGSLSVGFQSAMFG
ncbi:MAG: hypothetical protein MHM6MM_009207 [Cercozoa sp. M6MM]